MNLQPRWRLLWRGLWRLPRHALMAVVHAYRFLLSPWLGQSCRFAPTCSAYALQALQDHGAVAGTALTAWRVLRCQPWCAGGHDPVPPARGLFTRFLNSQGRPESFDKKNAS